MPICEWVVQSKARKNREDIHWLLSWRWLQDLVLTLLYFISTPIHYECHPLVWNIVSSIFWDIPGSVQKPWFLVFAYECQVPCNTYVLIHDTLYLYVTYEVLWFCFLLLTNIYILPSIYLCLYCSSEFSFNIYHLFELAFFLALLSSFFLTKLL